MNSETANLIFNTASLMARLRSGPLKNEIKKLTYEEEMEVLIKEYELIKKKESKLSANERTKIVDKVEYYYKHYKSKE